MHFHLPKPLHGWREFAGEVGIIVIGVLIALGAEQLVEAAHWKMEVDGAREALRTELDHDLGAVQHRQAQQACVVRRIDEVNAWLTSFRTGHPITLTGPIGAPTHYSFHSSVWEIVKSGQTAAHMSLADQTAYAQIYDVLQNISNLQATETDAWRSLAQADGAASLNDADIRRLRFDAAIGRNSSIAYATNLDEIAAPLRRFGLSPDRLKVYYPQSRQRLCASILPKR